MHSGAVSVMATNDSPQSIRGDRDPLMRPLYPSPRFSCPKFSVAALPMSLPSNLPFAGERKGCDATQHRYASYLGSNRENDRALILPVRSFQLSNVDFGHLQHRLHDPVRFLLVLVLQ